MSIVCAYCQAEGGRGILEEPSPAAEPTVSYGLCAEHRRHLAEERAWLAAEARRRQQEDGRAVKRRFERLPVSLPAVGRAAQFDGCELRGTVRYISAGGLMVEFPVEVVRGSILRVILPTREGFVEVEGHVVWTVADETGVRHGVAFLEPREDAFVLELVCGGSSDEAAE